LKRKKILKLLKDVLYDLNTSGNMALIADSSYANGFVTAMKVASKEIIDLIKEIENESISRRI